MTAERSEAEECIEDRMGNRRQHRDASPMERTLCELRARGQFAWVCEGWKAAGPRCILCRTASVWRRVDFLGFADIVSLPDLLAIQTTDGGDHAKRVTKIVAERQEPAWFWLKAGGRIEVWSWSFHKRPANGEHWQLRIEPITTSSLLEAGYSPPREQHTLNLIAMEAPNEDAGRDTAPGPDLAVAGGRRTRAPGRARRGPRQTPRGD